MITSASAEVVDYAIGNKMLELTLGDIFWYTCQEMAVFVFLCLS